MSLLQRTAILDEIRKAYPEKFLTEEEIFGRIHRGDRIFIGSACGEPQYLVRALASYLEAHPKAFFDAEVIHIWTLGYSPYAEQKFQYNFRHNSFFVADNSREAGNQGVADYTPIFLSEVPELFYRGAVPIDVAIIQTSPPDSHGYVSLGVSVDIVKAAAANASMVIAQVNSFMPRVHGDGFIHIRDIDFIIPYDEPLIEFHSPTDGEEIPRIGKYVASLIRDGDTIEVGYGGTPNAILPYLEGKAHLGVHTEVLWDGIVDLIKKGVVDNSRKNLNQGKTIASYCMGKQSTYEFIHDNPTIEFRRIDYTNNPLVIARHRNMVAINSALEIDLTGQATAESIGHVFYSGIGGQADFMRGAALSPGGRTRVAMQSTAENGEVSRIVPFLKEGAGVTLNRGDIHYVVTEYGIAYLHGKNIRERAMELIAIAHPKFRPWLIEEAKKRNLIYRDQKYITGKGGEYPEHLETYRTTKSGLEIFIRPVRISDEPKLKDFFYSLSDTSMYRRFLNRRQDMTHERLQDFVVVDYNREMSLVAIIKQGTNELIVGLGQYFINEKTHSAEMALTVRDDYQNKGIGSELLNYLVYI
ncbi:MAG: GNAT family N-acetyltransferase, partial [Dehalococcoidia bacterium]|nr:GNAT family N-acetyltransferase [Dehalococcoidia bacterium]